MKQISIPDTTKASLDRIAAVNKKLNAIIYLDREKVLKEAEGTRRNVGGIATRGIPIAIKDNICVKDEPTTCASRILKGFKPPYDATVIRKLKNAGFITVGKANMDEFAFGSSCETSCYGPTRNPWNLEMIPGGSSGGSAAAVAAGEVSMALGSDTGGSVRQPAALCGIVGMKPTYGRVSRYGLIAFASSLDQIGPLTANVTDCAALLNVISGHDEMDSTSADLPVPDFTKSLVKNAKKLKIGVPKEYFPEGGIDKEVEKAISKSKDVLKSSGAEIVDISLPNTEYALSCYYIIAPAEASSNLARFDGDQYGLREDAKGTIEMHTKTRTAGFGDEAKRRILLGTYSLSSGYYKAYYLKAMKVRTLIKNDFLQAFKVCDVILTATSPTAAFKIGEKINDPLSMYLSDIFTIPANLAGIPGISVPCGFTKSGLPVGMQFLAKPFDEETLIRTAYTFEQNTDFHKKKPNL
ncbi:MAG: Asp-tRNA(Asn)/Glu-tRNA(Gln) amidotransferase subunit GatA [Candidatus Omnitrophica bacterium]|nr:Asp-tRNA(Asn)/Glu-tRNA(Gln) amidotransferase subunit GatA [Candidatus Omnitrophota bacterium]